MTTESRQIRNFRQSDITRAIKAVEATGNRVVRVEMRPDGSIMLILQTDPDAQSGEFLDIGP